MALLNKAAQSFEKFSPSVRKDSQSRKICEKKIFSMKVLPDTNSEILKSLLTFFAKNAKNSRSEARKFSELSQSLAKKLFFVTKFLLQKKCCFEDPADQKYSKGLETFLSKSANIFEKKIDGNFFSPNVLWTRGRKSFQPLI